MTTAPTTPRRPGRLTMIESRPQVLGYVVIGEPGERYPRKFDHLEIRRPSRDSKEVLELDLPLMLAAMERAGDAMLTCGGCDRCEEIEKRFSVRLPRGLPRRIGVYLPSDDLDTVFPTSLAWYRGRRRFCYGDGETALRHEVTQDGDRMTFGPLREHRPCGAACPDFAERRCKPSAHLNFVLDGQHVVGGFYQFRTSSWASIRAIEGGLQQVQDVAGTIRYVPLVFELVEQRVQPASGAPAGKAQIARLYYPGSYRQLVTEARGALAAVAPQRAEIRRLEASISQVIEHPAPEAEAGVADEFYQAAPADDLNQDVFDPATGEVLVEGPTTSETGGAGPEASLDPGSPESAPADGAEDGSHDDPFGATPKELAAEADRQRGRSETISQSERDHLVQVLEARGLGTQARLNWIRRLVKRNVTTSLGLTREEYGQLCLELGVGPWKAAETARELEGAAS